MNDLQKMKLDDITDEELILKIEALKSDIDTKKYFVWNMLNENNMYDFLLYEIYKGDSKKMYEALADYYHEAYEDYCDSIIDQWFEEEKE